MIERIAPERPDERVGACQRTRRASSASATGKLDDGLARARRADPASCAVRGDLLLEVIHVGERRRPRLDHLERGQARADRAPSPATRSSLPPGRCSSAASPSAPGRRRARDTAPSAHGRACSPVRAATMSPVVSMTSAGISGGDPASRLPTAAMSRAVDRHGTGPEDPVAGIHR